MRNSQLRSRWSGVALAAAALLLCCASGGRAPAPKHIPRFAFDRDESPVSIPLMLRVMLVNMGHDAEPPAFRLDTDEFERLLFQLLPTHQPHCVETGEKLSVAYDILYDVVHTSRSDRDSLTTVLKSNMKLSSDVQHSDSITGADKSASLQGDKKGFVPVYDIHVDGAVEAELERIYMTYAEQTKMKYDSSVPMREGVYGLMVLNMDKEVLAPEPVHAQGGDAATSFVYRYKTEPNGVDSGSDAFVSRSRFALVDLSAGPSLYGSTQAGEGAVIGASLPRRYNARWQQSAAEAMDQIPSQLRGRALRFQAELAQVVLSAVRFVFAPDIRFDELDFSEKVLVPILVFRNHRLYDPLEPGTDFSIDIEGVKMHLQRLAMPGQKIEVVMGLQSLHEHERIAMALNAAIRADTVHESHMGRYLVRQRQYIDPERLFKTLGQTSDYLASGLISASPVLSSEFFPDFDSEDDLRKLQQSGDHWRLGTRVLPVFVFSFSDTESEATLFDGSLPYAASKDAVLVLQGGQTHVPVPFYSCGKQVTMSLSNPTAAILAGVGSALGGLMPWEKRHSGLKGAAESNFLWAHGFSPFGPFGNSTSFSQINVDQIMMNNYISRLGASVHRVGQALLSMDAFADTYLFDPLGEGVENHRRWTWLDRLQRREAEEHGALPLSYETVKKLHQDLLTLEESMATGSEGLQALDYERMHAFSDSIFAKASAFHAHVGAQLAGAEHVLGCCTLTHQAVIRTHWTMWVRAMLWGVIVAAIVALVAYLNPPRKNRVKPIVH